MILDNLVKAAFGIINTVAPSLTPQRFLDGMRDDFDPNLSDEENKKIMMQKIRGGKLGRGLAEVASYEPGTDRNFEEVLAEAESSQLKKQPTSVVEVGEENEQKTQKFQS